MTISVTYTFATQSGSIPLSDLDVNFANLVTGINGLIGGSVPFVTPVLGTPTSGNLANCTGYAFANLTGSPTGAFSAPSFIATETISGALNTGAYSYGTLSYTDNYIFASYQISSPSYAQQVIQNTNAGTAASTDFVVSNNNGTASAYYGNFGMNSSGWTGTAGTNSFNAPNMVYLTSTSVDLAIGTTTSNAIRFVINGGADAAQITTAGTLISTSAPNIGTTASNSTITPTASSGQYNVTALAAAATIAIPTGTAIDGQKLMIRIKDNGTARALTWTTSAGGYRSQGVTLPTTTVISTPLYVGCIYNAQDSYWDVLAVS